MTRLPNALSSIHHLGIDTAPLIYFVEEHPTYTDRMEVVFKQIDGGKIEGITSVISLAEVLIHPIRLGREDLRRRYHDVLLRSRCFRTLPIDTIVAERAADLRVRFGLRTPDALQIAVALDAGCEAFLTNDRGLERVTDIIILVLDDLEL